jgi:hypothetical protein
MVVRTIHELGDQVVFAGYWNSAGLVESLPKYMKRRQQGCSHDTNRPRNSVQTHKLIERFLLCPDLGTSPMIGYSFSWDVIEKPGCIWPYSDGTFHYFISASFDPHKLTVNIHLSPANIISCHRGYRTSEAKIQVYTRLPHGTVHIYPSSLFYHYDVSNHWN